ncbi:MAG TPA: hypothetical protein VGN80_12150 [Devosiaceae bacterium]|nr:hypothetical protein [Devosiaceae bacterium]
MRLWVLGDGWFYACGVEYGSAIELRRRDDGWELTSNIRVRKPKSKIAIPLLRQLFDIDDELMKRDRLTRIDVKAGDPSYSPTLGTVLFLDENERLLHGQFLPIEGGPMKRYYGDVTMADVAVLGGHHGALFSYDGTTLEELIGFSIVPVGWINRPIETGRTFVGGGSQVYEVRGSEHGKLTLVELVPSDRASVGWFYAVTMPNDELLFVTRHGIYESIADTLEPVWSPQAGQHIYGPADANRLTAEGLLVTTETPIGDKVDWLLSSCGPNA